MNSYYDSNYYDAREEENQQQRCIVIVNAADMVREIFNGILAVNKSFGELAAVQRSLLAGDVNTTPYNLDSNSNNVPQVGFVGIYNRNAYGVYDNPEKLNAALQYMPQNENRTFETYEAAAQFAKNGIANLRGVSVAVIPEMRYKLNWIERIFG